MIISQISVLKKTIEDLYRYKNDEKHKDVLSLLASYLDILFFLYKLLIKICDVGFPLKKENKNTKTSSRASNPKTFIKKGDINLIIFLIYLFSCNILEMINIINNDGIKMYTKVSTVKRKDLTTKLEYLILKNATNKVKISIKIISPI